jgi:hypothetical protein
MTLMYRIAVIFTIGIMPWYDRGPTKTPRLW